MHKLLFYTYADVRYSIFAVPYAFFALKNNPDSFVEIILADYDRFYESNVDGLKQLGEIFPGRFQFRQSSVIESGKRAIPNVIRFVEPPSNRAEFIYIGDIDLLVMDNVFSVHSKLLRDHCLPFSNIIRQNTISTSQPRLTGLHYCKFEYMYPLPDISDLDLLKLNDEHVLYKIMERKGYMVPESFAIRPECGIHMSLSRDPNGNCSGVGFLKYTRGESVGWTGVSHFKILSEIMRDKQFKVLYFDFSFEFRLLFAVLESQLRGFERMLHRVALSYMIDRRVVLSEEAAEFVEYDKKRTVEIRQKNLTQAEKTSSEMNLVWPGNASAYFKRAWIALANTNDAIAIECLAHCCDLAAPEIPEVVVKFCVENKSKLTASKAGNSLIRRVALGICEDRRSELFSDLGISAASEQVVSV